MKFAPKRWSAASFLLILVGCNTPPPPVPHLQLGELLGAQWTLLPVPNGKLTPGAVVQISPVGASPNTVDILWLGSLDSSCGVPPSVLAVQSGAVPGITAGTNVSINADLAAAIAGVSLGASGNFDKSSTLTINKASVDSVNLINLNNWLHDSTHSRTFESVCGPTLRRQNVYAVEEAFVISDGTYSIRNTAGAKVSFTPPPNVPVKADIGASGGPTGDLKITQAVVFALRQMAPFAKGTFNPAPVLGQASPSAVAPQVSGIGPMGLPRPLSGKTIEQIGFAR